MMRRALVLAVIALTAGCAGSAGAPATSTAPSPPATISPAVTPTQSPPPPVPFAVMVQRAGNGAPYLVQLVGFDGRGGPWVQALTRSQKTFLFSTPCPPPGAICQDGETASSMMPETSVSLTHVYFLDGDTEVKSLGADGTVTSVKNIQAPPNSQVVFAVSPDDHR